MKTILFSLLLIFVLTLISFGQNDWKTYPVRSIAQITEAHSGATDNTDLMISADPFPSKTTAVYLGQKRPISEHTKFLIGIWAQSRNLPAGNADMLTEEFLFREKDKEYWIPAVKTIIPFLEKELKEGDEIIVYYFFLGGYDEARLRSRDESKKGKPKNETASNDKKEPHWVFAVEEFGKPKPQENSNGSAYINQPLTAAVDSDPKNARKIDGFLIDARQVKSKSRVIYTGETREASDTKKRFLKTWAESQGHPLGILKLLTREAHFRENNKDYWLTIRESTEAAMKEQLKKGDEITIHTILAGGIPNATSIDWAFIVGDFSR